jgi:alkylation response protein AidB-like acyl-CoA dehydrogenase
MQESDFFQQGPVLKNQFTSDSLLRDFLKQEVPTDHHDEIEKDLTSFGERVVSELTSYVNSAEDNPPKLTSFDPWGNRIDHIETDSGWRALQKVAAEEGIVAHGYKRKFGEHSRIFQMAKLYLFHPSSAYFSCPLAMTDGAAKLLETIETKQEQTKAFEHLTSFDPNTFWTSGQWMTEKTGGSDVSKTETIAKKENGQWKLYGVKWFTSSTTSEMALALARIQDDEGNLIPGSRGLSLFYIELRDSNGQLKNIEILRLKDKLGTKALPTAELRLKGTPATLISEQGLGVKTISLMFNVTRIYNAVTATAAFRRILFLAEDYSTKRSAFGKKLIDHSIHKTLLAKAQIHYQSCFHLTFYVAKLLGICDLNPEAQKENQLLRILTPITKLYTAKKNMNWTSELLESFGGAGYIEDTGIPKWLRDAQVLTIWEGTTNVLSLDVLRSIIKEDTLKDFFIDVKSRLKNINKGELQNSLAKVEGACLQLESFCKNSDHEQIESVARDFAFTLGNIMAASLMLEFAQNNPDKQNYTSSINLLCTEELYTLKNTQEQTIYINQIIGSL